MTTLLARDLPGFHLRSVAASRNGNTVTLDDADRHMTIRVRFPKAHAIPEIDAMRPRFVLRTYLEGGSGALRPRFSPAVIEVR